MDRKLVLKTGYSCLYVIVCLGSNYYQGWEYFSRRHLNSIKLVS